MMTLGHLLLAIILAAATAQVSAQGMSMPAKPATAAPASAMPLVNGEVRKLCPATGFVVLKHSDIPNLAMPSMTMGFDVAEKKLLNGLRVGDKVRFQAEMIKGKAIVTEMKPVK